MRCPWRAHMPWARQVGSFKLILQAAALSSWIIPASSCLEFNSMASGKRALLRQPPTRATGACTIGKAGWTCQADVEQGRRGTWSSDTEKGGDASASASRFCEDVTRNMVSPEGSCVCGVDDSEE